MAENGAQDDAVKVTQPISRLLESFVYNLSDAALRHRGRRLTVYGASELAAAVAECMHPAASDKGQAESLSEPEAELRVLVARLVSEVSLLRLSLETRIEKLEDAVRHECSSRTQVEHLHQELSKAHGDGSVPPADHGI
eukprot:m51a1_g5223 hypothetical protein (139) ;mRNA; r:273226-273972